jgi:periplasmic protein CpxP/Spy
MSNHDPINEMPASASWSERPQRKRAYIAAAIAGAALVGGFASSSLGQGLEYRMLANLPGIAAAATREGGFGQGFAGIDRQSGLLDGALEAIGERRADRMIRHLSVEIDATADPQDKRRVIVRAAVKDLLPVRE